MLNMREKGGGANVGLIFPILEVFSSIFRGIFSPFFERSGIKMLSYPFGKWAIASLCFIRLTAMSLCAWLEYCRQKKW